jgi:cytochrome b561
MTPETYLPYFAVPLVLWRVYMRVKRLTSRQRSNRTRHWFSVVLFSLFLLGFGVAALGHPLALAALGLCTAAGAGLALVALRRTQFEQADGQVYFTPHARIGLLVAMLFVGRILWRLVDMTLHAPAPNDNPAAHPANMVVFGLLAGYYVMYAAGILRWRHAHGAA